MIPKMTIKTAIENRRTVQRELESRMGNILMGMAELEREVRVGEDAARQLVTRREQLKKMMEEYNQI